MYNQETVKQYIVLRKNPQTKTGEPVSAAKLAAMASHASMAFLSNRIKDGARQLRDGSCVATVVLSSEENSWITGIFTKILLEAKNLHTMERVVTDAQALGFVEGKDFFCIKDNCLTELLPDEGSDRCFMAIGFRPMEVNKIKPVIKRLQLYK